ncbi:homoserine kinase [Thermohalobacter berrensis]|uniref:Homoserine kinase n=1 Tax=Thermohalobacter berrensis TaxID=99594 RepID=A0A419SUA9_9FIRM|nr:homoserine kinase [Thermohalobacter berrensis]RKD28795.1 homoserine kinase [Thermohalobacter berrensis]
MIKIRVPATSANIGPGFDCLGIALNMYNTFFIEEIEKGVIIEGCEDKFCNENNLVYSAMKKSFEKLGYKYKGIKINIKGQIPVSRGLGSSAACILAGVIGANEIASAGLNREEILQLATEIEGHPDNVTPALFGGMTASVYEKNRVYYSNIKIQKGLKFCTLIPDFQLSTAKARAVLPKKIDYEDGVFNVGRVSLMISALTNGQFDLIKIASKDKLHENYRGNLIRNYHNIVRECEKLDSLGTFLSGAGPTIMAVLEEDNKDFYNNIKKFLYNLEDNWEVKELQIDYNGVVIENT